MNNSKNSSVVKVDLAKIDNLPYYIEKENIRRVDEDYNYEEVPVDDFYEDNEESLDNILHKTFDVSKENLILTNIPRAEINTKAEVTDDFIRNFLIKFNLLNTLNCFQNEWYENLQKGKIKLEDNSSVPDIYVQKEDLNDRVSFLQHEVERFKAAAERAKEEYVKMRKERDYHRMHHNRVTQEKNRLITDLKKLKLHYDTYEPLLKTMKVKYDTAIREKVLNQLERDRALAEIATIKNNETTNKKSSDEKKYLEKYADDEYANSNLKFNEKVLDESQVDNLKDSEFPVDNGFNPYLINLKDDSHHLTTLRLSHSIQAHSLPISSISIHPRKLISVTTSDDKKWKMWTIPDGQMIMQGEGHTDWVSGSDFHPTGNLLATSSGDSTVKVWNFDKSKCVHTFSEHLKATWSVSWHSCGNFLASASMDNTAKVWDLNSLRCRYTLRGHTDSVNTIEYLLFSNTLLTASTDKTISLWDSRTGLLAHTLYGHTSSCNQAHFSLKGDMIISCDSVGVVKVWDIRKLNVINTLDFGPSSVNAVALNGSGSLLIAASEDTTLKAYNLMSQQVTKMVGHEEAVQCVKFDMNGGYLLSGGCDNMLRIWS